MNINDLRVALGSSSVKTLLPLSEIKMEKDKAAYSGYNIMFTRSEWVSRCPNIPESKVYYQTGMIPCMVYYDPEKLIYLEMNIMPNGRFVTEPSGVGTKDAGLWFMDGVKQLQSAFDAGEYWRALLPAPNGVNLEMISLTADRLPAGIAYELFIECYSNGDYGCAALSTEEVRHILSLRTEAQIDAAKKDCASLEAIVKVFRGEGNKSTETHNAFSWTTSKRIALFFAARNEYCGGRIIGGQINRDDIVAYITDRDEDEVFCLPESVTVTGSILLSEPKDVVKELSEKELKRYKKYREILHNVYEALDAGQDGHDESHSLRVLLFGVILGERCGLSNRDMEELCTAAVWHDTGRRDGGLDEGHGARSAELYRKTAASTAKESVAFLIENHCVEDGCAAEKFAEQKLPKRLWTVFCILKDADALDRARFGIRNLNPDYLRNERAIGLVPFAVAAQEGVKLL